jgi:hypothetical protein
MMRSLILFGIGLLAAWSAGWYATARALYVEKAQPLAFNHLAHTGEKGGMACEDCHSLRPDGSFSGIPKLDSCAACHTEPLGETQAEKEFIEKFVRPGIEPRWHVYSRQPDNAWFPHSAHIKLAQLKCEQCHGDHGKTKTLPAYRENRISGYSQKVMQSMRMDDCVSCHHSRGLAHSCLDCHK